MEAVVSANLTGAAKAFQHSQNAADPFDPVHKIALGLIVEFVEDRTPS